MALCDSGPVDTAQSAQSAQATSGRVGAAQWTVISGPVGVISGTVISGPVGMISDSGTVISGSDSGPVGTAQSAQSARGISGPVGTAVISVSGPVVSGSVPEGTAGSVPEGTAMGAAAMVATSDTMAIPPMPSRAPPVCGFGGWFDALTIHTKIAFVNDKGRWAKSHGRTGPTPVENLLFRCRFHCLGPEAQERYNSYADFSGLNHAGMAFGVDHKGRRILLHLLGVYDDIQDDEELRQLCYFWYSQLTANTLPRRKRPHESIENDQVDAIDDESAA